MAVTAHGKSNMVFFKSFLKNFMDLIQSQQHFFGGIPLGT
jgi:hypothetical protein